MEIQWSEFKRIVNLKSLSIQWIELNGNYHLKGVDGAFILDCVLPIGVADSDTTDFETNFKTNGNKTLVASSSIQSIPSFTSKTVTINGTVKKLFARNTGFQHAMSVGANVVEYALTYPWVKILGVEVIGAETLDYVDLQVLDNSLGSYSGVPNLVLNQFAFSVNIPKDYYIRLSQFDADLYQGMKIKFTYNSVSAKTVGFNLIMNELKD
jgi:hypothetical protein